MMMMMLVGSSKRRKLQIVVKISVNFGNVFRCCGCGCYFATLWWPFAVASATVVVVRFVVSAFCQRGKMTENLLKHGNTRQREIERKRSKTARRVERKLCDFRVRKVCSVSSYLPLFLPPPTFNSYIFVANFWHFSWTTFSACLFSCQKYFFEISFHFIFFFSSPLKRFYFISMFFMCWTRVSLKLTAAKASS